MPKPRSILFINDIGHQMGGAEHSLVSFVSAMDRDRFSPCVVLGGTGMLANTFAQMQVPTAVIPMPAIGRTRNPFRIIIGILNLIVASCRIWRFARHQNVDMLYANKNTAIFYTLLPAFLLRKPCIWHVRNRATRFGLIGRFATRRFKALLFVSDAIRSPFDKAFPKLRDKFHTLLEGIEARSFAVENRMETRVHVRNEIGIPLDLPVVGMVGRVTPWKGQAEFLNAAPAILNRFPNTHFVIVGSVISSDAEASSDEEYMRRLIDEVKDLGLSNNVHFTGYRRDVNNLMASMDIFVLPSWEEPYGLVVTEAMSAGIPCVATGTGGVPEIAKNREHALLIPPKEPGAIAAAVIELLENRPNARAMAERARKHIYSDFSYDNFAQKLQNLLTDLLVAF